MTGLFEDDDDDKNDYLSRNIKTTDYSHALNWARLDCTGPRYQFSICMFAVALWPQKVDRYDNS